MSDQRDEPPGPPRGTLRIGVLADPGLPTDLADWLVEVLPGVLGETVSDRVDWDVTSRSEPIVLGAGGRVPVAELARRHMSANAWDLMLLLTDLPRRSGARPIASEVSLSLRVGLVSVPALGAVRLRHRTRRLVVGLVWALVGDDGDAGPDGAGRARPTFPPLPLSTSSRQVVPDDPDIDRHVELVGPRGKLRLLSGMVRDNRPWRLVPHLSSATAAAAATAAYTILTSSFWDMAISLSTTRLALITIVAIGAMEVWLIAYNNLWDRPADEGARSSAVLYNAATVLTLLIGVACMYLLLYVAGLLAAVALIDPDYLARSLQRPAGADVYLKLGWLSTSIGIVAGALGSSLESEDEVRDATYGRRELLRRREGDTGTGEERGTA